MIIGITGTIGAGKGTVVEHLKTKGFTHYAARDFLIEEIQRRGLPVDRDSMTTVANELRHAHGPSHIIATLLASAEASGKDAVVESIRAIGEAKLLKERGAILLAVDADQRVRYERIIARGSSTDHVDFATFEAQEAREMQNTDPEKQNIAAVMAMADYRIENVRSVDELHARVDEMLAGLRK